MTLPKRPASKLLYLENNMLTITVKLPDQMNSIQRVTIDIKKFPATVHTLIKDVKSMLKAKSVKESLINEIGFQIGNTLNQEENYKLFKDIEEEAKRSVLKTANTNHGMLVKLTRSRNNT